MDSLDSDFSNDVISDNNLPHFEEIALTPIDRNYLFLLLIQNVVFGLVVFVGIQLAYTFVDDIPFGLYIFGLSAFAFFLILRIIFSFITFKNRGYALREHDVIFKSGVFMEVTTLVPYNRIQHLVFERSMWEKLLGLSRLECYTSGGGSADLVLYGIRDEKLKQIQEFLQLQMQKETDWQSVNSSSKIDSHEE